MKAKKKAEKAKILDSIVKSNHMVLEKPYEPITGKILFPDMADLSKKSIDDLKKLRVSTIAGYWDNVLTVSISLNDGQTCEAGTDACNHFFDVDESKHICKIEVITYKDENVLGQIIFYDKNGVLYKMGTDVWGTGRKETFHIAANERLIGCEFDHGAQSVLGVTFLKWTI